MKARTLQRITAERKRQDEKYSWDEYDDCRRLAVLTEELGEVARAVQREDPDNLRVELIHLASAVIRWFELDAIKKRGINMVDLDELESLRTKATAGPLVIIEDDPDHEDYIVFSSVEKMHAGNPKPVASVEWDEDIDYLVALWGAAPAMIAELRGLREALEEAVDILPSYRVFITTREKAKDPEGWVLWDKTIDRARTAVAVTKKRGV